MMGAAMISVGSTITASKFMAQSPVFVAAFVRFAIASPVLMGILWCTGKRLPPLTTFEWLTLCGQAAVGSVGYSVLLIAGVSLTRASDASVIAGTLPAVAALFSFVFLRERINRRTLLGIALATLGVAALAVNTHAAGGVAIHRWMGNALVLSAIGCEAVFLLLNKTIKTSIDPLLVAATMSTLSMMFCAGPALYQWLHTPGSVLYGNALGAAVYYALVPTVLGFYLWYKGASLATGTEASMFTAVYPIAGLLLSAAVVGEVIETQHWLGVTIAALGIIVGAQESPPRSE